MSPDVPSPSVMELDTGPGLGLRQAREQANLSIEEVAARLHLDTRTLGRLEADNYDALPAPTFVRGYLRSYARLLDIAPEPIIDSFDRRGLEPPPLVADISTSGDEARSTDTPMRMATAAIIVVSIAFVGLSWQARDLIPWPDFGGGEEATSATTEPLIPELRAQGGGELTLPALRSENTDLTAPLDPGAGAPALRSEEGPLAPVNTESTADTTATTTEDTTVTEATTASGSGVAGVGHLVLRVRRDSWIEVYDREGERLYYSTARAGDAIDLRAAEPLKVLLGFAAGVQVEYNGQSFDPSPHTARGLARFSLGG